jgi:hypothetical protein
MKNEIKYTLIGIVLGSIISPIFVNIISPYVIGLIYPIPKPNLTMSITDFEVYNMSTCPEGLDKSVLDAWYLTDSFELYRIPLESTNGFIEIPNNTLKCIIINNVTPPSQYVVLNITKLSGCKSSNPCKEYTITLTNEGESIASDIFLKLFTTKQIESVSLKDGMEVGTEILTYKNREGLLPNEYMTFWFTSTGSIERYNLYSKEQGEITKVNVVKGKQIDCSCIRWTAKNV